jgi:hypothetical protein
VSKRTGGRPGMTSSSVASGLDSSEGMPLGSSGELNAVSAIR